MHSMHFVKHLPLLMDSFFFSLPPPPPPPHTRHSTCVCVCVCVCVMFIMYVTFLSLIYTKKVFSALKRLKKFELKALSQFSYFALIQSEKNFNMKMGLGKYAVYLNF